MDTQSILVILLFAAAILYVGRMVYRAIFQKKGACGGNCKCGVDFSNIEPHKK